MSTTTVQALPSAPQSGGQWDIYKGWVYGLLIVLAVLLVGTGLWFHFHP